MRYSLRFLLAVGTALAIAAPCALAKSQLSPGQLKNEAADQLPAATAPVVEAPTAPSVPVTGNQNDAAATTPVKPHGTEHGNRATTKVNAHRTPAPAPAAVKVRTAKRVTPHASTRSQVLARTRSAGARATHRSAASRGGAAPAGQAAGATGRAPSVAAPNPAAAAVVQAHTVRAPAKSSEEKRGPFSSVALAADHVVEVIPGAVVLALAGLAALVVMLLAREILMDRRRMRALEGSYGITVEALAVAIEAKDHTTGGHIERVRRLGLLLAGEIAPREARDPQMAYGFLLHDIGKLAVPDAILTAPGHLSNTQWVLMRRHPEEGVRMLSHIPFLDRALDIVHYHHERWDGGGYPEGLRGEEIPLWARIFSVVDALDAITAERPYGAGQSYESALEEIRRNAGTQFDPSVVDALEAIDPARIVPLLEPSHPLALAPAPAAQIAEPVLPPLVHA